MHPSQTCPWIDRLVTLLRILRLLILSVDRLVRRSLLVTVVGQTRLASNAMVGTGEEQAWTRGCIEAAFRHDKLLK